MPKIALVTPDESHELQFLAAVHASRKLHRPWTYPPNTPKLFDEYLASLRNGSRIGYLVVAEHGGLAAWINIGGVIRGLFQNGFLGYSAFLPYDGQGYVSSGLRKVITLAFREHRLHRLEANIQPGNSRSIHLARRLGFAHEGFSRKYLKIGGRWADHERFAMTADAWRAAKTLTPEV